MSGYTSINGVVNDPALGPLAALSDDELNKLFVKVLTSIPDGPVSSGEPGIGGTACVKHCVRVKATIYEVALR